jgi:hypothetical protein
LIFGAVHGIIVIVIMPIIMRRHLRFDRSKLANLSLDLASDETAQGLI